MYIRFGALQGGAVNIIGYKLEHNEKWGALYGISTPDGGKVIIIIKINPFFPKYFNNNRPLMDISNFTWSNLANNKC